MTAWKQASQSQRWGYCPAEGTMNDLELLKSRSSSGDRMIRAPSHSTAVGSSVDGYLSCGRLEPRVKVVGDLVGPGGGGCGEVKDGTPGEVDDRADDEDADEIEEEAGDGHLSDRDPVAAEDDGVGRGGDWQHEGHGGRECGGDHDEHGVDGLGDCGGGEDREDELGAGGVGREFSEEGHEEAGEEDDGEGGDLGERAEERLGDPAGEAGVLESCGEGEAAAEEEDDTPRDA